MDVLNPGGTKSNSSGPPPPGPPAMMSGPPQPFSGTFFVPQQPPGKTTCGGLHVGTIIVYKMNCSQCKATLCVCVCVSVCVCVCVCVYICVLVLTPMINKARHAHITCSFH